MPRQFRSAYARIAQIAIVFTLSIAPLTVHSAQPVPDWARAVNLTQLVDSLEHWLDAQSPYSRRATAPNIRMISQQRARVMSEGPGRLGSVRRGLYDPETQTIFLVRPWSPRKAQDVSVLLHELIHHRQETARHWYCPAQQELPAYRLQAAWLAENGASIAINWAGATLASGCTPSDIHP